MVKAITTQLRQLNVPAHALLVVNLHAEFFDYAEVLVKHGLREAILRDCAADHATAIGMLFEDFHGKTSTGEFDRS